MQFGQKKVQISSLLTEKANRLSQERHSLNFIKSHFSAADSEKNGNKINKMVKTIFMPLLPL